MFTLFQNFADLCLKKLRFFLDFANSRLPLKDNPIFRESGYERATRFARMGAGGRGGAGVGNRLISYRLPIDLLYVSLSSALTMEILHSYT